MKIRIFMIAVFLTAFSFYAYGDEIDYFPPLTKMPAHGITLTSPDEKGWFVSDPDGKGAYLLKVGPTKSETYAIVITMHSNNHIIKSDDELLDYVKRMNRGSSDRFKYRLTNEEFNRSHGVCFVSYYGLAEDHLAPQMPKGKEFALLEISGFYARHPDDPGLIIQVEYSYRYYPGHEDLDFKKKAEWVFKNAFFTKP
ncbi:MAG: hypothetical protein PHI06_13725 [Desulfobulbaceae bacterium]|nr:hypothetical protein [Desulfobulbaceae bacterium]